MVCFGVLIASLFFVIVLGTQPYPISLSNSPDRCGDISVPYPFGTTQGCYFDDIFFIHCDETYDPPKAFFGSSIINVTEIMLSDGQMRIYAYIAHQCFQPNGTPIEEETNLNPYLTLGEFQLSYTKNKFTVVGGDVYAYFQGSQTASTGCIVTCSSLADVVNGTCTRLGCCQMSIPKQAKGTNITLKSFSNHTKVSSFDPCSYAFAVEETNFTFNSQQFYDLASVPKLPVIVDWMIGDQSCVQAKMNQSSYVCKGNSYCYDSDNGPGYRCNCSIGYEGNPYLPTGCQDIDECKVLQPCIDKCLNLPGTF